MSGIRILTLVLLIAGLSGATGRCLAAQGQDSLQLDALRLKLANRSWARASGPWGVVRLEKPRVVPSGLEFMAAAPYEPGAVTTLLPNPIPLAQAYRIEIETDNSSIGALYGGVLGACVGAMAASELANLSGIMGPTQPASGGDLLRGALLGAVPGALLGAFLGSLAKDWKLVYPVSVL